MGGVWGSGGGVDVDLEGEGMKWEWEGEGGERVPWRDLLGSLMDNGWEEFESIAGWTINHPKQHHSKNRNPLLALVNLRVHYVD